MRRVDSPSIRTPRPSAPVAILTRNRRLPISRSTRASAAPRLVVKTVAFAGIAAAACSVATPAAAHGFGQRYDLPLPLAFYLFGTASAVVLSFVIAGLVMRRSPTADSYPRINLLAFSLGRLTAGAGFGLALRLTSLVLFAVTIAAGFWGDQNPYRNIAPT